MAVAFRASAFGGGGTRSSLTLPINVPAGIVAPAVDVAVYYGDAGSTVASVLVGGAPAQFVVRSGIAGVGQDEGNDYSTERWVITGVPSGPLDVVVTLDSSAEMWAGAAILEGVDQAAPVRATAAGRGWVSTDWGGRPALMVASAPGDLVIDALAANGTDGYNPDSGQTVFVDASDSDDKAAGYLPGASPEVECAWLPRGFTNIVAGMTVVSFKPPADDPDPDPLEGEFHTGLRLSFSFTGSAGRSGTLATTLDTGSSAADQPARTGESETPLEVESDATGIPARHGTTVHQLTTTTTAHSLTVRLGETLHELAAGLDADGGRADAGTIAPGLGVAHEAEGTAGRSGSATHHLTAATDLDGAAGRRGAFTAPLDAATDATGRAARSGDFALYLTSRVHLQGAGEDDGTGYATRLHVGVAYAMHSARSGGMPVILHTAITADGQGARLSDILAALSPEITLEDTAGRRGGLETPITALVGAGGRVERLGALTVAPALSTSTLGRLARSGAAAVRSALRVVLRGRMESWPTPLPQHIARAAAVRRVAVSDAPPRTAQSQRPRRVVG